MADIKFLVTVDAATATAAIKQIEGDVQNLGKTTAGARQEGDAFERSCQQLWKQFVSGQVIVDGLRAGFNKLKQIVHETIEAASDAEKTDRALDAALDITGRHVPGLADHYKEYAKSLMQVTVYDDEAIKKGQTLLLQMVNLDREGMDKATRGAIGLASVMGMDLQSAFALVEKGMIGNTGALGRYGIKVAENLPLEEKRAAMLTQLERMFGRATDEINTHAGKVAQLRNRWKEAEEALGTWITRNQGYLNILNAISQALLDYLTKEEMVARAEQKLNEGVDRQAELLGKAAVAAGWKYGEMAKLIVAYNGNTAALIMAIQKEEYGIAIKEAWAKVHGQATEEIKKQLAAQNDLEKGTNVLVDADNKEADAVQKILDMADPQKAALRELVRDMELVTKAFREGAISSGDYKKTMDWLQEGIRAFDPQIIATALPPAKNIWLALAAVEHQTLMDWQYDASAWEHRWTDALQGFAENFKVTMDKVKEVSDQLFGQIDSIFSQSQKNKEIALDNEYKKRLETIKKTIKDETAQRAAITALDAEYDLKRRSLQHEAAQQQKAASLAQAIINTAEAVTNALRSIPFPFNLGAAALMGALGAVQVKLIASQPLPYKEGTVFTKPTLFYTPAGREVQIGEGGEPEVLAPESKLRQTFREEIGAFLKSPALAGRAEPVPAPISLNINSPLIHTTAAMTDAEIERQAVRLAKSVDAELRRLGRRL